MKDRSCRFCPMCDLFRSINFTILFNCLVTCWRSYVDIYRLSDGVRACASAGTNDRTFARYIFICATVCERVRPCATVCERVRPCATMLSCQNDQPWLDVSCVCCKAEEVLGSVEDTVTLAIVVRTRQALNVHIHVHSSRFTNYIYMVRTGLEKSLKRP